MRKLLAMSLVLIFVVFAGCAARTPGQGSLPIVPLAEDNPPKHERYYLNSPPLLEEPEQPPASSGEVQMVRSPLQEGEKIVALTFDDGPHQHTSRILDVLEEHGGAATFFVLGYRVENHRSTMERAVRLGNEIAGHSWNHQDFSLLTEDEIAWQIKSASEAIAPFVGSSPRIYRPPYGRTNELVRQVSQRMGYAIINWTLDPRDWENRDADHIYDHIMSTIQNGDIIVMHDIYATTAQAMERVIPRLIEEGYRLVTVSELIAYLYGEIEPGVVYGRDYDVPMV
ncbi:MAG: polysaccharide deacetylase family protein [Oscillospiraceae bacterium]|nr:polysaccharide deacetylase family protein [Oscillospiraceae bacterium]